MSETIDVRIEFVNRENATFERSQWLDGLQAELRKRRIDCTAKKLPAPENTQSLGFTEWIDIVELTLNSIGTLFGVLSYFKESKQTKKSIKSLLVSIADGSGAKTCVEIEHGDIERKTVEISQKIDKAIAEHSSITSITVAMRD